MNEQKERFETPEAEVILFGKEDVITTSSSIIDPSIVDPDDGFWD